MRPDTHCRYTGRRRKSDGAEFMARIVADQLVEHLRPSGFVSIDLRSAAVERATKSTKWLSSRTCAMLAPVTTLFSAEAMSRGRRP